MAKRVIVLYSRRRHYFAVDNLSYALFKVVVIGC